MLALGFVLTATAVFAAGRQESLVEPIPNSAGFAVDIPGCADASKNIREIAIDELNIDVREMTTGVDVEYRLYGPGLAHWGSAKFTSACTLGGSKELQAWFQEAAKGKNIRKNISVTLFKSDKSPGRGYILHDCFPTQWSLSNFDTSSTVQTETLTVNIGRIEFKTIARGGFAGGGAGGSGGGVRAEAASSDKFAQVRGFKVEISGSSGKEVDTAWESVSGGDMVIELTETTIGSDKSKTSSPGHKTVGEITLRGAMTDGRKNLCAWINDTVNGRPWKRDLRVTQMLSVDGGVKDGKQYIYSDCFPIRYVFPRMSVSNTTGNTLEEVTIKVVRLEREIPLRARTRLAIPGATVASRSALLLAVDDMAMDVHLIEKTGDARNPSATLILTGGTAGELLEWNKKLQSGQIDLRDITVDFLIGRNQTVDKLLLESSFPFSFRQTQVNGAVLEEVSFKPIRVELK